MDSYSRFHDVVTDARARSERLQREASEQRLLQQLKRASPWRSSLAAQLHRLAERLEPQSGTPPLDETPSSTSPAHFSS